MVMNLQRYKPFVSQRRCVFLGKHPQWSLVPLANLSLMDKGFEFAGHTGYLGHLCEVSNPVMAFSGGRYQVVLVTTHIPFNQVAPSLTTEGLFTQFKLLMKHG